MNSQQQADEALSIYRANRDDQARMDSLLREYFRQVRADEYAEDIEILRQLFARKS